MRKKSSLKFYIDPSGLGNYILSDKVSSVKRVSPLIRKKNLDFDICRFNFAVNRLITMVLGVLSESLATASKLSLATSSSPMVLHSALEGKL
ncbi:hypothetical protein BpHYR1_019001 [Brachionus plicatilis]|uniref:Uncharacterized protein n=1 Tax=Brachionus plicatilis TaxID=10195 RepID=A0A3M7RRP1_BRAPC|nr:hypothetical protein BpHYR1_019001 [Brachionus plicatilis]